MSSSVYAVKVLSQGAEPRPEIFYTSAASSEAAVKAVRAQVGPDPIIESDVHPISEEEAARLGLLSGQVKLG